LAKIKNLKTQNIQEIFSWTKGTDIEKHLIILKKKYNF